MEYSNWRMLGGLAAATAAGVYVLWGPGNYRRGPRKRDHVPGLMNLGNTCFLNAILQGLAPCRSFVTWLGNFIDKRACEHYTDYIAFTLIKLLKGLNNEGSCDEDPLSAYDLTGALHRRRWVISQDEQDAHELFHVLTESLDEETSQFPAIVSLLDVITLQNCEVQGDDSCQTRVECALPCLPPRCDNMLPFRGLLATQLTCRKCAGKNPVKHDTFDSLSLTIPESTWGVLTLERLLREFTSSECVGNVDCEACHKIQSTQTSTPVHTPTKTTFNKKMTISKPPQCLCLHIQRTVWLNNGHQYKKSDYVKFGEMLVLDEFVYHKQSLAKPQQPRLRGGQNIHQDVFHMPLSPVQPAVQTMPSVIPFPFQNNLTTLRLSQPGLGLTSPTLGHALGHTSHIDTARRPQQLDLTTSKTSPYLNTSHMYRLSAVVVHLGSVEAGHFVTYRRAPGLACHKWLYTSDTMVKYASLGEVLESQAYMLFYEKI